MCCALARRPVARSSETAVRDGRFGIIALQAQLPRFERGTGEARRIVGPGGDCFQNFIVEAILFHVRFLEHVSNFVDRSNALPHLVLCHRKPPRLFPEQHSALAGRSVQSAAPATPRLSCEERLARSAIALRRAALRWRLRSRSLAGPSRYRAPARNWTRCGCIWAAPGRASAQRSGPGRTQCKAA